MNYKSLRNYISLIFAICISLFLILNALDEKGENRSHLKEYEFTIKTKPKLESIGKYNAITFTAHDIEQPFKIIREAYDLSLIDI